MAIPFWTRSGTIDLSALQPQDMTAEILADTLSKQNRFGGRTASPWPLTSHLCLVAALCPIELKAWALLHDAGAAFLGEIMSPALEFICEAGTRTAVENAFRNARVRINRAIGAGWGVVVRSENHRLLDADRIAVQAEAFVLLGTAPQFLTTADEADFDLAVAFVKVERDLHWQGSRALWLSAVKDLASLGQLTLPKADEAYGIGPGV